MDKDSASTLLVRNKPHRKPKLLRRPYFKKLNHARQNYKREDVLAAMHAIWRGMSQRKAAKVFNIPRSTLLEKLDGKRPLDASPGPNPFLTKLEERQLEGWALEMNRRGFSLRTEDLKDMAQALIQSNQRPTSFKNGRPGRSWMRNFLLRHPRVFELSADGSSGAGAVARRSRSVTTREEVRQWCQQHRNFMISSGYADILDDPGRVFNLDHGEFLFDATTGLFLEQHRPDRSDEQERDRERLLPGMECVSVAATFSASGRMAPLMFVYPRKELPHEVVENFPTGWVGTHSDSGFLTVKAFFDYLVTFRRWLEKENVRLPVLLLVDGRRCRLNMDVTRYCEEQGIVLYCLFPTPRPAVAELFSAVFHDSPEGITKFNLALRFQEALNALDDSDGSKSLFHTYGILPHLQTMLQTLEEVASEPLQSPYRMPASVGEADPEQEAGLMSDVVIKEELSDCECDYDLMPIEGEIEMEFPGSWDPHALAALHPGLLAGPLSDASRYMTVGPAQIGPNSREEFVDQPDLDSRLVVVPISSPLPETDRGIEEVESEINKVLSSIISLNAKSYSPHSEEQISPPRSSSFEEPFRGFSQADESASHRLLDALGCRRFLEEFLSDRGLLENFKAASVQRQWDGPPEAKHLFEVWLAAFDLSTLCKEPELCEL